MTDEPAVLMWMAALAPRPRVLVGRHWWREFVTRSWRDADDAWQLQAEAASNGWTTELNAFKAEHPRPTLKTFMQGLSSGRISPRGGLA